MLMAVLGVKPFAESGGWPQARAGAGATSPSRSCWLVAISTLLAWAVYRLDKAGLPKSVRDVLLVLVGYGPLCAPFASGQ
jgi:hypothetical protein